MHGGRGTSGPKTEDGRKRTASANTKTGEYTKAAKLAVSKASARLAQLEDAMHVLGMTTAIGFKTRYASIKAFLMPFEKAMFQVPRN